MKPAELGGPPPLDKGRWLWHGALAAILLLAAALRLTGLTVVPPGLNQDAAIDAWDAWCVRHTGVDHVGDAWPVLCSHGFGENRPALQIYCVLPFQLLFGPGVLTTRLPQAVGGVLTVWLAYHIGRLLFCRAVGLTFAALLALNPWHLVLSRIGHQAGLCPLLVCAPLALVLWSGVPVTSVSQKAGWWRALLAGLCVGVVCYGYFPVRLFLPLLLLGMAAVTLPSTWRSLLQRRQLLAVGAFLLGAAATFGPLAYAHLMHPEKMARRGETLGLWLPTDGPLQIVGKILARWTAHFGPNFLFINGDPYEVQSPVGFGQYHWYLLPLALVGVAVLVRRAWQSPAARVALCWLVLYPVGDILHTHQIRMPDGALGEGLHALRSAPGLPALLLVGAVGAIACGEWLYRRGRMALLAPAVVFGLLVIGLNVRFLTYYFTQYPQRFNVYHGYQADLVEALDWIKPRLPQADAAFITTTGMNVPYAIAMVVLGYDPHQWQRDEKDLLLMGPWENYRRVGKLNFIYDRVAFDDLQALMKNGRPDRVLLVTRPGELGLRNADGSPLVPQHVIRGPAPDRRTQDKLHVFELTL